MNDTLVQQDLGKIYRLSCFSRLIFLLWRLFPGLIVTCGLFTVFCIFSTCGNRMFLGKRRHLKILLSFREFSTVSSNAMFYRYTHICRRFVREMILAQNRGERIVFWWPNTNTNIIPLLKNDRIRIRILFSLKKSTEYEYYSVWKNHPNTNANTSVGPQLFK